MLQRNKGEMESSKKRERGRKKKESDERILINLLCSGWFWECPNGGKNCKYRHALPKDYVLKKDKKRMEKEAQAISIEELIEKERANLDTSKLTKVTLETFVAWKKKKLKEKALAEKKEKSKKEKQGTVSGIQGSKIKCCCRPIE